MNETKTNELAQDKPNRINLKLLKSQQNSVNQIQNNSDDI